MCPLLIISPVLGEERGADVRRSALQLHGAAVLCAFPGRDDVRGGKKYFLYLPPQQRQRSGCADGDAETS